MSEPKYYYGDPPHERERQRLEAEGINKRAYWVRSRRLQYSQSADYDADLRRSANGWDDIKGPDGKGVNG